MLANNGDNEGLFRAAFMESGSPPPTGWVDEPYLQDTYDQIVGDVGCAGSNDTLACLRGVPAEALKAAMDKTPSFVSFQVSKGRCASPGRRSNGLIAASEHSVVPKSGWRVHRGGASTAAVIEPNF